MDMRHAIAGNGQPATFLEPVQTGRGSLMPLVAARRSTSLDVWFPSPSPMESGQPDSSIAAPCAEHGSVVDDPRHLPGEVEIGARYAPESLCQPDRDRAIRQTARFNAKNKYRATDFLVQSSGLTSLRPLGQSKSLCPAELGQRTMSIVMSGATFHRVNQAAAEALEWKKKRPRFH
jgi:hypothetical protein